MRMEERGGPPEVHQSARDGPACRPASTLAAAPLTLALSAHCWGSLGHPLLAMGLYTEMR